LDTDYDGEYWQFPFAGGELRLSHNNKLATFENNGDIWLIDFNKVSSKNLTNTSDYSEKSVTWSPDDKSIAFLGSDDKNLTDIFIMDIASGVYANITNTPSRYERCLGYPQCSFGWWLQFPSFIFAGSDEPKQHQPGEILRGHCHTSGGECNIFPVRVSLDGKAYTILDKIDGVEHLPSLSPNGKYLAYDGGIIYNLETDERKIIYPSDYGLTIESWDGVGSPELVAPIWSPGGELIAWLGHTNSAGDIGLYVFDLEHNSGKLLTSFEPYFVTLTLPPWQRWTSSQITWSPDSNWITLSGSEWDETGENAFLWIFSNDGKINIKFDTGDYEMVPPVWSPDSKKLIFLRLFYVNTGLPPTLQMIDILDWMVSEIDTPENTLIYPVGWFNP
jgi:Tol biopolymer transport system component